MLIRSKFVKKRNWFWASDRNSFLEIVRFHGRLEYLINLIKKNSRVYSNLFTGIEINKSNILIDVPLFGARWKILWYIFKMAITLSPRSTTYTHKFSADLFLAFGVQGEAGWKMWFLSQPKHLRVFAIEIRESMVNYMKSRYIGGKHAIRSIDSWIEYFSRLKQFDYINGN